MTNEPIFTMSQAALYDLLATAAFMTLTNVYQGWMPPEDRSEMAEIIEHLFPPFAVRASLRYAEAGRPDGAEKVAFMEADLAEATANGHEGYMLLMAEDLAALKAQIALAPEATE